MALVRPPVVQPVKVKPVGVSGIQTDRNPYGAGVTIIDSDAFTGGDSINNPGTTDILGLSYTQHTGVWGLNSNQLYLSTVDGTINGMTADFGVADCSVSVAVYGVAGAGIMMRAINDADRIELSFNGNTTLQAAKRVGGAFTLLNSGAVVFSSGGVVTLTANGPDFRAYYQGALIFTFSDSAGQTRTRHGVCANGGTDGNTLRMSNLVVTVP